MLATGGKTVFPGVSAGPDWPPEHQSIRCRDNTLTVHFRMDGKAKPTTRAAMLGWHVTRVGLVCTLHPLRRNMGWYIPKEASNGLGSTLKVLCTLLRRQPEYRRMSTWASRRSCVTRGRCNTTQTAHALHRAVLLCWAGERLSSMATTTTEREEAHGTCMYGLTYVLK